MSLLTDKSIALLGSATINMQNAAGAQTIFTTAAGKTTRITHVIIRDNTASLAGGTDFDFTNWVQNVNLSSWTSTGTIYRIIHATDNSDFTELAAGTAFQITPSTGATAAGTAVVDVFGYTT